MRTNPGMPRRSRAPSARGRVVLVVAVVVLFLILTSLRGIAGFYTDYLWFDSLELRSVWSGVLVAKFVLGAIFTGVFFVLMWVNLVIADRLAPRFRPAGPEEQVLERYHDIVGGRTGTVRVVTAALFALIFGVGVSGRWNEWLLYTNRVDFGVTDEQFGRDIGFYVFELPFLGFVVDWLFAAFVVIAIVTAVAHYLNGGIRLQTPAQRVTPQVKAHISVLFGVLAVVKAAGYYLDRFELTFSSRGVVDGASYTDVNAQLPAINLLILISAFAALLFLYNIRQRGWVLPIIAVGLWGFVAVVAGGAYPAFVQRFRVEPAESTKEAQYIERNIAATRQAMGLDDVQEREFDATEDLAPADLEANADTIRNVRLWDPAILERTYQRLQEVRSFYRFTDVDVDRYVVDDELTQVVLSARELNADGLPEGGWENRHLAYTHGFGAVLSPANAVTSRGEPDFIVKDVPPVGVPEIEQPRLYYGESLTGYAITGTERDEIDYPRGDGLETSRYDGTGGIGIGSYIRRMAFALRFNDINPLISGFMTSDSRIQYIRDVRERVETLAPFLHFDADPYPVVIDGRILWVIDGYTTTNRYPYAQRADTDRLPGGSGLNHRFNYVRNSVKATVDAYDGDATFYVIDEEDPIIAAWQKAFPKLFTDQDEIPAGLREHFRYPEDVFRVQTNMWGQYHIGDASGFYSQTDAWNISQDPGTTVGGTASGGQTIDPVTGRATPRREDRMDPYYLLMRLPDEELTRFLILQPFVPFSEDDTRKELSAFMVAKSDPDDYGELETFVMPRGQQVDGPALVEADIQSNAEIASELTLLDQEGSEVLQGNLLLIPIKESLLYIRPIYIQAASNRVPLLRKVIVAYGDRQVMQNSLREALESVFGDAPETREDTEPDDDEEPDVVQTVQQLLDRAARAFAEADAALAAGDLGEYQDRVSEARRLIQQAAEEARPPEETTTTTTPEEGA